MADGRIKLYTEVELELDEVLDKLENETIVQEVLERDLVKEVNEADSCNYLRNLSSIQLKDTLCDMLGIMRTSSKETIIKGIAERL